MNFESLVLDLPIFKSAIVSLDVAFTGVIWGWFVTMNLWGQSIGTGVFFVGLYMLKKYPKNAGFYKAIIPIVGILFILITLMFTALDLHQMFRAWHMFIYPHFTSVINLGSWVINLYMGSLAVLFFLLYKQKDDWYEKALWPTAVFAFFTTIYTAGLLAQCTAREIWQGPTEVVQMLMAAGMAGSAILLLLGHFSLNRDEKTSLSYVLGFTTLLSFTIYMSELYLAPFKSEEAEWVIHYVLHGDLSTMFWAAMVIGYILPMIFVLICHKSSGQLGLTIAAVTSLIGLWMAKHVWLVAPQMIPLS
jgi:predicted membrane protein